MAAGRQLGQAVSESGAGSRAWKASFGTALIYLRTMAVFLLVWHLGSLYIANPVLLPSPLAVARQPVSAGPGRRAVRRGAGQPAAPGRQFRARRRPRHFARPRHGRSAALLHDLVDPLVELLRPISGIAWIPLGMFILGVGEELPVAIMFYGALFPFLINTMAGRARRSTAAGRRRPARWASAQAAILRQVVLPAALPNILVGARLAAGAAWMAMVAAELIGAPSGLGFAIEWYRELLMTPKMLAFVFMVGFLGYLVDRGAARRPAAADALGRPGGGARLSLPGAAARRSLLPVLLLVAVADGRTTGLAATNRAPSPARVAARAAEMIASGELRWRSSKACSASPWASPSRLRSALLLGAAMGAFRSVGRNLDPLIESFRPIAPIALLPLAILWFGTGTPAAAFIVAYAAFFPMLINTIHGVRSVDRRLVQAARTLGVSGSTTLRTVLLPGALPSIFVGARLALGVAWTAIIAAELAVGAKAGGGATGGIGQMMFVFYAYSVELNGIVVCMIAVGVVALLHRPRPARARSDGRCHG